MFNRIRSIRKRWFVVAATAALLTVGLVSGAVFAASGSATDAVNAFRYGHDYDRSGKEHGAALLARVAEIIGVEQETLAAAFQTALDEQAGTKFNVHRDALVAAGTLTQEQADAATAWFNSRPDRSGAIALRVAHTADTDRVANRLAKLVDAEKLTQEQADAISAWHAERPAALPEFSKGRGGHRGSHKGRGYHDH